MPTYEYRCKDCGHELEVVQSFTDDALTECPCCGGNSARCSANVGITFKGSGFYKTDSRSGSATAQVRQSVRRDSGAKKARRRPRPPRPESSTPRPRRRGVVVLGLVDERSSSSHEPPVGQPPSPSIGVFGGSGFTAARRRRGASRSTRRGAAVGPGAHRLGRRPGSPSSPATAPATSPAAPGPVPGQRLGPAVARGSRRILGPCAGGSLRPDITPATSSCSTSWSTARGGGPTPSSTARSSTTCRSPTPTAPSSGATLWRPRGRDVTVHDGGTVVVVQGPRFSTRAEAGWYRAAGLARHQHDPVPRGRPRPELGLCYAAVALVTDYDTGVEDDPSRPVTHEEVFEVMAANVARLRKVLFRAIGDVPGARAVCGCAAATNGVEPVL